MTDEKQASGGAVLSSAGLGLVDRLRLVAIDLGDELAAEAADEIERLCAVVKAANSQAERFERLWYLRGDALEWYRDEARALAQNMERGAHTVGVLASVTVLSLDAGTRADMALGA